MLHWIGNTYISNGFPSSGMPALFESHQLAERMGEERLTLVASFWMTAAMIDRDPRRGLEQLEDVLEAARKYHNRELEAHALAKKAMAHARLGEFEEAQDAVTRAQEVTRTTDSVMNGADVAIMSSQAFFDMGDVRRGLEYSRQGTEQAMSASGSECAMYGHYSTGLGNLHSHNLDEAQQEFESALKLLPDFVPELQGREQVANEVRAGLAITQFFRGRTEAINDIKRTLANAEAVGDEYTGAFIAQALGEAYTQMGDFDLAKQYLGHRSRILSPQRHATLHCASSASIRQLVRTSGSRCRGRTGAYRGLPADGRTVSTTGSPTHSDFHRCCAGAR